LEEEREAASENPREKDLPWPERKIQEAEIRLGLAAGRMLEEFRQLRSTSAVAGGEVEGVLRSLDGKIGGQPDLVIHRDGRPVIVDYKSGGLADEEKVERYSRQLHFYAFLWHEVHGEWPTEAWLVNPITNSRVEIPIRTGQAEWLASDAIRRLEEVASEPDIGRLGNVGEHCSSCPYRPWCRPYWDDAAVRHASTGRTDIEGEVLSIDALAVHPEGGVRAVLVLSTLQGEVTLRGERGPALLLDVHPGTRLRVMDARADETPNLLGITSWTEVAITSG
jgi:hypothetical protein